MHARCRQPAVHPGRHMHAWRGHSAKQTSVRVRACVRASAPAQPPSTHLCPRQVMDQVLMRLPVRHGPHPVLVVGPQQAGGQPAGGVHDAHPPVLHGYAQQLPVLVALRGGARGCGPGLRGGRRWRSGGEGGCRGRAASAGSQQPAGGPPRCTPGRWPQWSPAGRRRTPRAAPPCSPCTAPPAGGRPAGSAGLWGAQKWEGLKRARWLMPLRGCADAGLGGWCGALAGEQAGRQASRPPPAHHRAASFPAPSAAAADAASCPATAAAAVTTSFPAPLISCVGSPPNPRSSQINSIAGHTFCRRDP